MSQPPYPPQSPAAPIAGGRPPAAPTQVGFPGQLPQVAQPQFAPSPQQAAAAQGGPLAVGFPNYRSPAPSPPNRTGLIVGTIVVLATVVFAVVGFLIVGGRGANSPEGAVEQFVAAVGDRDAGKVHDLLCDSAAASTSESQIASDFGQLPPGAWSVDVHGTSDASQDGLSGQNVDATLTIAGQSIDTTFFVVEDKGWRVCGSDFFAG